jgi:acyl-CoA oxidase
LARAERRSPCRRSDDVLQAGGLVVQHGPCFDGGASIMPSSTRYSVRDRATTDPDSGPVHRQPFWRRWFPRRRLLAFGGGKENGNAPSGDTRAEPHADGDGSDASGVPMRSEDLRCWLYHLSPEGLAFREQVKEVLSGQEFATERGLTQEEQAQRSYSRFKLLRARLDLRLRDVRERPGRLAMALGLVGIVDATLFTVMNIHYCLCGGSFFAQSSHRPELDAYIEELDSGETIGAYLLTELGYGNNVISLKTRADYDAERRELVLSTPCAVARKFMPNTALPNVPKLGVVMARLFSLGQDRGVFPVLVRLRDGVGPCEGVSIVPLGDKPAFSLDNAITSFDGVRVPKCHLLLDDRSVLCDDGSFHSEIQSSRARFLSSIEQVQLGRLCLSSLAATARAVAAFVAIKYGEQRRTFAPRHPDVCILDYRSHQRDVFSALAHAYASRCLVEHALTELVNRKTGNHDHIFRVGVAAKAFATYEAERYVRLCRERCGAAGLLEENRLSAYAAQVQGLVTAEGDNLILLIKMARQMLQRQGYSPPSSAARGPDGSLPEEARLIGLFRERERRMLNELRRGMAPARLPGHELFDVWNDNITLALETARAHSTRLAAEAFSARIAELPRGHAARHLFELFGLRQIEPHLGFYLAEDLLTRGEVKAHRARVDDVCRRLRASALELAEACDVPNSLLRIPLASDDYIAHYDRQARQLDELTDGIIQSRPRAANTQRSSKSTAR